MNILSAIGDFFDSNKKESLKETASKRKEMKEKFSIQLKEVYFMNEDEIKQVLGVVDSCLKEIDDYKQNFDYSNYDFDANNKFETGFIKLRNKFDTEVKTKINEIMKLKLIKAKKFFGIE